MSIEKDPNGNKFIPYMREDRLPHIFCPGCGNGSIMNAFFKGMEEAEMDFDNIAMVSGIGCSSRIPGYVKCDSLHTTHGRALSFATGLKVSNSDLDVVVFTGDGDAASIGGNHLIHAARRNINLTVICINNNKFCTFQAVGNHSVYCISTASANTNHFNFRKIRVLCI